MIQTAPGAPDHPSEATAEERANLALIHEFRSVPLPERRRFLAPGFVRRRGGMVHLPELSGMPDGFDVHTIADRRDEVVDIIAKGDRVWATWQVRGTHAGTLFGIEATQRPLDFLEVGIWRIEDGLIADMWFFADELGVLRQLGVEVALDAAPHLSMRTE